MKKINPKCAIEQIGDTTLSSAWIAAMSNGQQPSAPEDYIEVENKVQIEQEIIKRKNNNAIVCHNFHSFKFCFCKASVE